MKRFAFDAIIHLMIVFILSQQLHAASLFSNQANFIQKDNGNNDEMLLTVRELSERRCGYEGCPRPKPDMLNVHIVPHTHDDVGWLKTVDQYYYGSKTLIQKAGVQYIIDSVVQELLRDPNKRFIYVESEFFFKWWKEQSAALKEQVKQLVNEGRLEFIGGAWSMNDEATTHYQSTIDQFTWGLRKLNDTFGECGRPKVGWQIDPFGHSREMASLLAQMGYDGLFVGRIDYQDKAHRLTNRNAEMVWRASDNLGEAADIFTGALYNTYSPPPGFCFDILCADEPIIDDKQSPEYNVERRVNEFFAYAKNASLKYRSNNILITMGDDFNYQDAQMWFKNLDKLILYANERQLSGTKINLFYSTPSCYLKALHDANITWPSKHDDFFPYASDPHAFWTGYFTSRPTIKRFERIGNNFLQVCKQLSTLAPKRSVDFQDKLTPLREAMGIMQHHDAVTGTEKQHVANDYNRILTRAIDLCGENTREALNQLTIEPNNMKRYQPIGFDPNVQFDFSTCRNLNVSSCEISENSEKFVVTLYNPIAHSTYQSVRVPLNGDDVDYQVLDYRNVPIDSQIVPIPDEVQDIPSRGGAATHELVFVASELPPLGYKSYFVQRKSVERTVREPHVLLVENDQVQSDQPSTDNSESRENKKETITISNKYFSLIFDENGLLSSVDGNGVRLNVQQNFYIYESGVGGNIPFQGRSSGAYIFVPRATQAKPVTNKVDIRVINGDVVDEVHQKFNDWISQVIRLYKNENIAEFEWLVGPIPIKDFIGREIITRFDTDIQSNGIFYTDSNGREMLKRQRNHRDTWNVTLEEPVSGNYYPVTTKIAIEDDQSRLAILNDRSQGGSSLSDGSIELMVHRRLLRDDGFGVKEPLNETAYGKGLIVRGTHYLVFGSKDGTVKPSVQARERFAQLKVHLPSWAFFSNASDFSYDTWRTAYTHIYSALSLSLPQNVHLLTFEPWQDNSILLRFEHILAKDEDDEYSKPVKFNLQDVFRSLGMVKLRETTLAANQWLNEAFRLNFAAEATPAFDSGGRFIKNDDNLVITLNPMQIRTFVAKFEYSL